MTREDIVKAASKIWGSEFWTEVQKDRLEKFATLVASSEREECAKVCETGVDTEHPTVKGHIMKNFGASSHLATAIRARSNT